MGLFRNRHNKDDRAETEALQNGAEYRPDTINLWDDRRPPKVHHAVSVDEILSGLSLTPVCAAANDTTAETGAPDSKDNAKDSGEIAKNSSESVNNGGKSTAAPLAADAPIEKGWDNKADKTAPTEKTEKPGEKAEPVKAEATPTEKPAERLAEQGAKTAEDPAENTVEALMKTVKDPAQNTAEKSIEASAKKTENSVKSAAENQKNNQKNREETVENRDSTVRVPKAEPPKYKDPGFHAEVEIAARPGTPAEQEKAEFSEEFFREPQEFENAQEAETDAAFSAAMNAAGKKVSAADGEEDTAEDAKNESDETRGESAQTEDSAAPKSAAERADELIRRLKAQAFSAVQGLSDEEDPENNATDVLNGRKAPDIHEDKKNADSRTFDSESAAKLTENETNEVPSAAERPNSKEDNDAPTAAYINGTEKSTAPTTDENTANPTVQAAENPNESKEESDENAPKSEPVGHRAGSLTAEELLGISMSGTNEHPTPNVLNAGEVLGKEGTAVPHAAQHIVGLHHTEDESLLEELFLTRAEKRAQRKAQKKAERMAKKSAKSADHSVEDAEHSSESSAKDTAESAVTNFTDPTAERTADFAAENGAFVAESTAGQKLSEEAGTVLRDSAKKAEISDAAAKIHTTENTNSAENRKAAEATKTTELPNPATLDNTDDKTDGVPHLSIEVPESGEVKPHHPAANTSKEESADREQIKLSPTAQVLYDRMMAELVLEHKLHSEPQNRETADEKGKEKADESSDKSENIGQSGSDRQAAAKSFESFAQKTAQSGSNAAKAADVSGQSGVSGDGVGTENVPQKSRENRESLADSIFNSLSESLADENPLSRQKSRSADSLLSKCRSYVNPKYDLDAPTGSIDDIIHSAEKGARERLSNFYDIQSDEPVKRTAEKHDFSAFTARTAKQNDDLSNTISIPVKLSDESSENAVIKSASGDIKNFQYSFADHSEEPDPDDLGQTRVVDIQSSAAGRKQVTDPEKMKQIKMHLQKLAEEDPEDDLEKTQKVKFTGVSEPEVPDTEVSSFDDDLALVDDYKDISDAQTVRTDLSSQRVSVIARLIPTAVITAVLFLLNLVFRDALVKSSQMTYTLLNLLLTLGALCINLKTLRGFVGVVCGAPDMDSPSALAAVTTLLYTFAAAISGNLATLPPLAPIGTMALTFNLFAKLSILKRVRRGFEVIANDREKKAVTFVADRTAAKLLAGDSVIGDALIATGKSTKNITNYLKNAYSEDAYEKRLTPLIAGTLIVAAVFSLIGFFAGGGLSAALVAFCTVTLVACPPSALFACNLPLSLAAKSLADYDAMIAGPEPLENISNANAVAFDVCDLFPAGTIKLYNMQVLNKGAVDRYLAAAAAVLTAAKSPLSPIFEEILQSDNEKIPEADSVKYENNMGVSGWIGDHRVFVGNRTLMEGHSIRTPSLELDKKILRQGYFPVYLAFDNMLCALFIVGYEADEEITYELRRLCSTGVTMLVNSNDPNISGEMLCDYFGLYKDSVKVMGQSGVSAYKNAVRYVDSYPAFASYGGKISGFLASITAAIRAKSLISILMILQIVFICLGVAVTGYWIFSGVLLKLPVALFAGAQLLCAAVTSVVGYLKQP